MLEPFKDGTIYILNKTWADHYSEVDEFNPNGTRYDRAKPVKGSTGCWMTDCWICDREGNIHPSYCNSPVPVGSGSVKPVGAPNTDFLTREQYAAVKTAKSLMGRFFATKLAEAWKTNIPPHGCEDIWDDLNPIQHLIEPSELDSL